MHVVVHRASGVTAGPACGEASREREQPIGAERTKQARTVAARRWIDVMVEGTWLPRRPYSRGARAWSDRPENRIEDRHPPRVGRADRPYRGPIPGRGPKAPGNRGPARLTEGSLSAETGACFLIRRDPHREYMLAAAPDLLTSRRDARKRPENRGLRPARAFAPRRECRGWRPWSSGLAGLPPPSPLGAAKPGAPPSRVPLPTSTFTPSTTAR